MRLRAIVHSEADWNKWIADTKAASGVPTDPRHQRGFQLVSTGQCIACHTIQGTPLQGKVGPNLTRYGTRTTMGSGMYENSQQNLVKWLLDPKGSKPGNLMPRVVETEEDANAIAAYLLSLK
jgi:cytochrome c oxidase subunit 2